MKRPSSAKDNQKKLYVGHPQKNFMIPRYLPNIQSVNINNYMQDDNLEDELRLLQYSWVN